MFEHSLMKFNNTGHKFSLEKTTCEYIKRNVIDAVNVDVRIDIDRS